MTELLHRLAYFSRNSIQAEPEELAREVQQILNASRRNNVKVNVTGALLFNSTCFAQVLEGPLQAVEATFERIQRDNRHADVTVLELTEADCREFPEWSMAYAGRIGEERASFSSFSLAADKPHGPAGREIHELLNSLMLQEQ